MILPVTDETTKGGHHYHYYEGVTYQFHATEFAQYEEAPIFLYLAWGDGRSAATVFDHVYNYNNTEILRNIMLHPVVEVDGELVREALEDLDMAWKTQRFIPA